MEGRQALLNVYRHEIIRTANRSIRLADTIGSNNIGLTNQLYSAVWACREYNGQILKQGRLNVNDGE